jgi:alginate production protein
MQNFSAISQVYSVVKARNVVLAVIIILCFLYANSLPAAWKISTPFDGGKYSGGASKTVNARQPGIAAGGNRSGTSSHIYLRTDSRFYRQYMDGQEIMVAGAGSLSGTGNSTGGYSRQTVGPGLEGISAFTTADTVLNVNINNKYDFDAPPTTRNSLARWFYYGGAVEFKADYERNYNLDDDDDADILVLEPQLKLAFTIKPTRYIWSYTDFNLKHKTTTIDRQNNEDSKTSLTVKRAYVMFDKIMEDFSFKVGRQRFKDKREWFYDEELDGARLYYRNRRVKFEVSASRENYFDDDLLNSSNNDDKINNYFVRGQFKMSDENRLSLYALVRDDRSGDGARPVFLGTQVRGKYAGNSSFWLSGAYVIGEDEITSGEDKHDDIRAYGFDLGTTLVFDTALSPSLTFAYAWGSGDSDLDDDTNKNFRQTDLQDNNARFNGVTSFKYYGELMDPELSNMSIWYGGIGLRPAKKTSIDLVYHQYRQVEASDDIRDSNIDTDPNGVDRDLGQELDLVIGYQEVKNLITELVVAYFWPGDAFSDDADDALFAGLQMRYNF